MSLSKPQTGTKILGSFFLVSLLIVLITCVALWRMHALDTITRDLVQDKLAKQQLASDLLGVARLNGLRVMSVARSDSLELADLYKAQLADGEREAARIETRIRALPASVEEGALLRAAGEDKAAFAMATASVFKAKDIGRTQEAEELVTRALEPAFLRYTASLGKLLRHQADAAHALADDSASTSAFSRVLLLALGALALAAGAALGWLLTRSVVVPLQQAVSLAEDVARGDLRPLIAHRRGDELGRLFDALNGMTGGVSATVTEVLRGAHGIDAASGEIAAGNQDLSQRTERQAGALRQTVQAMEALTAAIASNNDSAREANLLAQSATTVAGEGAAAVAQLVARMGAIKASADKIVDITGMIDSIAFQTNILALNAAVEAARAGAEGRGFAVVAAEVRNLAQHSAGAAKQIKQLIGASAGEIEAGTGIAEGAGDTMRAVLGKVQEVATLLGAIHGASELQADGVGKVGRALAEIDLSTQQNAAMVEEAAAAAESMREQAAALARLVGTFQLRQQRAAPRVPALA
ncbi:methyl-accepting chemotaxis protein [Massilia sp. Leaf139]|uniref:methyl-accepting chemotaxis protein n=1 Tax=Massilia sp. Leaf139 TaxID=1736272 RepID=UPI000701992B|nr:methyl-accepting chemotaxis protein [Massilia sp. Leaf139]KQQ89294.1 chemotaxis protein [Massilia sp. Leaf139]